MVERAVEDLVKDLRDTDPDEGEHGEDDER